MMFIFSLFLVLIPSSLSSTESNGHILVIAPPLLSHAMPTLALAKRLSTHCHVTYLTSALKVEELQRKGLITAPSNSDTLDIVGLNDGNVRSIELLLQDFQISLSGTTKIYLNYTQQSTLNTALSRMGSALHQWFQSNSHCLSPPCQSITTRPIPQPINMIITRSITPMYLFNLTIPQYLFLPSNLRGVLSYLRTEKRNNSQDNFYDHLRKNIDRADGFICNSLREFDGKYLDDFYRLVGKKVPVHFIGPLIFDTPKSTESKTEEIINWLDAQPVASVVYIAFGSMARLPLSVIDILAKAFSPYSFIWSLKTDLSLPSSLLNLDPHRQLLLEWTPQREILAHPSISFFFSHGGWNSLLEGMIHGKAILVWPIFADQFDNARQLVELGMGRRVSEDLKTDIESMLTYRNYTDKAKEIQQIVIQAQESSSKAQIANIVQLISSRDQWSDEL